jgi:hypothetical protein
MSTKTLNFLMYICSSGRSSVVQKSRSQNICKSLAVPAGKADPHRYCLRTRTHLTGNGLLNRANYGAV